jgi:DNA-directed RNA polymerase subunit RPC12/RpoP
MHSVLRTVATFEYAHFAHLAKTKLESEGIECFIFDEHTSSMNWFYTNAIGGIKLKVRGEEYERAVTILKVNTDDINNIDDADETIKISCPECSSDNIRDEKFSKKFAYLSILLFGFPLLFRKRKYECKQCGFKWNK